MKISNVAIFLVCCLASVALTGAKIQQYEYENRVAASRVLKDANGRKMGEIKGDKVYDTNNRLIGYANSSGTKTVGGTRLSQSNLPGLLFCK